MYGYVQTLLPIPHTPNPCREMFEAEVTSRKINDTLKRQMPVSVIQRLQQGSSRIADSHEEVSKDRICVFSRTRGKGSGKRWFGIK